MQKAYSPVDSERTGNIKSPSFFKAIVLAFSFLLSSPQPASAFTDIFDFSVLNDVFSGIADGSITNVMDIANSGLIDAGTMSTINNVYGSYTNLIDTVNTAYSDVQGVLTTIKDLKDTVDAFTDSLKLQAIQEFQSFLSGVALQITNGADVLNAVSGIRTAMDDVKSVADFYVQDASVLAEMGKTLRDDILTPLQNFRDMIGPFKSAMDAYNKVKGIIDSIDRFRNAINLIRSLQSGEFVQDAITGKNRSSLQAGKLPTMNDVNNLPKIFDIDLDTSLFTPGSSVDIPNLPTFNFDVNSFDTEVNQDISQPAIP